MQGGKLKLKKFTEIIKPDLKSPVKNRRKRNRYENGSEEVNQQPIFVYILNHRM